LDSVTHIVLGAALGELSLGKKLGKKALWVGALANTIPDFDVFVSYFIKDEMAYIKYHRAYTQAIPVQLFMALPLAWIGNHIFEKDIPFGVGYMFWLLGFFTHSMIDCCTTYGTRLWLPFSTVQVAFNNLAIVDIIYMLPFLILFFYLVIGQKESSKRAFWSWSVIGFSLFYLGITFFNKFYIHQKFVSSLKEQNIQYDRLSTSPSILNNILWAGIATNDTVIYTSEYSLLQNHNKIKFFSYKRNINLLKTVNDQDKVNWLTWFSNGYYFVKQPHTDTLHVFTIKWGQAIYTRSTPEENFILFFKLINENGLWMVREGSGNSEAMDWNEAFVNLYERISGNTPKL